VATLISRDLAAEAFFPESAHSGSATALAVSGCNAGISAAALFPKRDRLGAARGRDADDDPRSALQGEEHIR